MEDLTPYTIHSTCITKSIFIFFWYRNDRLLIFYNVRIRSCWHNCFDYRPLINSSFSALLLTHVLRNLCQLWAQSLSWVLMDRLAPTLDSLNELQAPTSFMLFYPSNHSCPLSISPKFVEISYWMIIPFLPLLLFSLWFLFIHYLPCFYFNETWEPWINALLSPTSSEFHIRQNLHTSLQMSPLLLCLK